jgi:hypothetical protein
LEFSERSFARRKAAPKTLLPMDESERVWRFAEVLAQATSVFGSQAEAERWLGQSVIGLDHRKPIELLRTHPGARLVSEYLTRIDTASTRDAATMGAGALKVWRLDSRDHAETWDSGAGAAKVGGRWNPAGYPVVYCSADPSRRFSRWRSTRDSSSSMRFRM